MFLGSSGVLYGLFAYEKLLKQEQVEQYDLPNKPSTENLQQMIAKGINHNLGLCSDYELRYWSRSNIAVWPSFYMSQSVGISTLAILFELNKP